MTNIQAIDLLKDLEQSLDDYCELNDEGKTAFRMAITALELFGISEQLPSAQPEPHYDEWCDDCKEYDKERHCCPRWNRVIRRALKDAQPERKTGRWIYGEDNPGTGRDGWFCSECEHFEMWDYSADMKSAELNLPNFCPNCGARMTEEDV